MCTKVSLSVGIFYWNGSVTDFKWKFCMRTIFNLFVKTFHSITVTFHLRYVQFDCHNFSILWSNKNDVFGGAIVFAVLLYQGLKTAQMYFDFLL